MLRLSSNDDLLEAALVSGVERNKALIFLMIGLLAMTFIAGLVLFLWMGGG